MTSEYAGYREWKGWSTEPFGVCDAASSAYFSEEMRLSGLRDLRGLCVLEVGFGNGAFADWVSRCGARYIGTEAIPELVRKGREAGFVVHEASTSLNSIAASDSIDVAVILDVFEHLDRDCLVRMLVSLRTSLKRGGRLVARIPSGDSPFARAIQYGDLTHRSVLGSSAVQQLARAAEFDVVSVREPAFPLQGLGPRVFLRRTAIAAARALAYPFIARVLMNGGRPVLTPNLVFVLVKP